MAQWNPVSYILYMCICHITAWHGTGCKTSALVGVQGLPSCHCLPWEAGLLLHTIRSVINVGASEEPHITFSRLAK